MVIRGFCTCGGRSLRHMADEKSEDGGDQTPKMAPKKKKQFVEKLWHEYTSVGKPVPGTPFISFKTPIDKDKCENDILDKAHWFTPDMLHAAIRSQSRTLGMVIDLGVTEAYYNAHDAFEVKNIRHYRIFCPGKGKVPQPERVKRFNDYVEQFLKEYEGKTDGFGQSYLIGVTSKQGVNRTTYFVSRYLIEMQNWPWKVAIREVEDARGHYLERGSLIKDLRQSDVAHSGKEIKNNWLGEWSKLFSTFEISAKSTPDASKKSPQSKEKRVKKKSGTPTPRSSEKKNIPKGWLDYTALSKVIKDTRFVVFKSPLDQTYTQFFENATEQSFTPEKLLAAVTAMRRTLGLVIDLTVTDKFYNPQELEKKGIKYRKIALAVKHGELPPSDKVKEFQIAVDGYVRKVQQEVDCFGEPALIGVHSIHGINRAGYMVCRFMVERIGGLWTPLAAMDAFAIARGHAIQEANYVQALSNMDTQAKKQQLGVKVKDDEYWNEKWKIAEERKQQKKAENVAKSPKEGEKEKAGSPKRLVSDVKKQPPADQKDKDCKQQ